jgi:NADPH:quinone reductase-like Zn-dependent oxidoreductase
MTKMMRAAVVRKHGDPSVINIEEIPAPVVEAPNDVVVRVKACALNRLDLFVRSGMTGSGVRPFSLPHVSGSDVAGEIVSLGSGAEHWQAGDRVLVYPGLGCGHCPECERGEDSMCRSYRVFGEDTFGGLAEYTMVRSANLEPLPEQLPFEVAAAVPVAYTTAWRMVVTAGRVRPSERVLVLGAGGGVGSAAVEVAHASGAYVFAVTKGLERASLVMKIGGDRAIDRGTEDFQKVVLDETDGEGVDLVVNPVGGETFGPAIDSLAIGGRMTICGAAAGDNPPFSIRETYQSHRSIIGAPLGSHRDFRAVLDLVNRGVLQPHLHAVLPLEQVSQAHRLLEEGVGFGKVVIVP